eukprot:270359_1
MGNTSGSSASRSVGVRIENKTSVSFFRDGYSLSHGVWTNYAPQEIAPNSTVKFMSESNGFMTGTEGYVYYKAKGEKIWLKWNNPYAGGNTFNHYGSSSFNVSRRGGSGDNGYVYWTITEKTQPKKKIIIKNVQRYWKPKLTDYKLLKMVWRS